MLQMLGNPEVPKPNLPIDSQEDILGFQISMNNLSIMNMLNRKAHLSEPSEHLLLRKY